EQVHINVPSENWERIAREQLKEHGCPTKNVFFHFIKTNESWCRDHGPAFVVKGKKLAIVDWGFNAWGGKYPPYDDDDAVPTHVAWLTGGIEGDDTDGHIDDLARFVGPRKLVVGVEADPKDANCRVLRDVRKQAGKLRDQAGKPFEIIEIPMPSPVVHDGQRLPATYVNFYFVNGALLVPTYRDRKNDRK